jgi:hypothetical protein
MFSSEEEFLLLFGWDGFFARPSSDLFPLRQPLVPMIRSEEQ